MKKTFKEWLREWNEDRLDWTAETAKPVEERTRKAVKHAPVRAWQEKRLARFSKVYPVLSILLLCAISVLLSAAVIELPPFGEAQNPVNNEAYQRYVENGAEETGAVNIVAGVILDYRAFDTLGESHVLYTALTAVLILLLAEGDKEDDDMSESFIRQDKLLQYPAMVLLPIMFLIGFYLMLTGHLGPGGGFSGGSVLGAGLILHALAFGFEATEKLINAKTFKIVTLVSLGFYSLAKCYSFFCGANELPSIISTGVFGRIFSAGLILPLNIAVGLVVATTMYGIYSVFKRGRI